MRQDKEFDPENYAVSDEDDFDPEKYAVAEEKQPTDRSFFSKLPANIVSGLAQMGHGLINTPHNLVNMVSPDAAKSIPSQPDYNYAHMLGLPDEATTADKVVRGLAQYGVAAGLPVADMAIGADAAGLGARMAANAVPQAAFGATQNADPISGAEEGAIAGAGGEAIGTALKEGVNALKPTNFLRGNLSNEELEKNVDAARGTRTPLGQILASPALNRLYENFLPNIFGSGAERNMQKTANVITDKAGTLLNYLDNPENTADRGAILKDALTKAAASAKEEKNAGYDILNDFADLSGHRVERKNLRDAADSILTEINSSPELARKLPGSLISDLKFYKSTGKDKEAMQSLKDTLNAIGIDHSGLDSMDMTHTLRNSNIFRSKIGEDANTHYLNGEMYEYGVQKRLKDALTKDIDDSFKASGNDDLKKFYAKNQQDYREKYAPFEDPDIVKFTRQGGDPDTLLPYFLRGGQNDRAVLLRKLTDKLTSDDPKMRNIVAYAHLSKALNDDGTINAMKMSNLYRKLGPNQKKALIPDEQTRNELDQFTRLVGMNKEAFNLMYNPKTGARNSDPAFKLLQAAGAGAAGVTTGLGGALSAYAVPGAFAKLAEKMLSSPNLRKSLTTKMLNKPATNPQAGQAQKNLYKTLLQLNMNEYKGTE